MATRKLGKSMWKSRTFWIGMLSTVSGALLLIAQFLATGDFSSVAVVMLVNGVVMMLMRKLTTEPIA